MKRLGLDPRSLPVQIILSFIALVVLTAVAVGLPAIWLIRYQLQRQAWAQVEQGSRAAQALYTARGNELISLATLTAERPTLQKLLEQQAQAQLSAYLQTLQAGAGLDLVLVCDSEKQALGGARLAIANELCAVDIPAGLYIQPDIVPQPWLFAAHPLEIAASQGQVIVGIVLNNNFAAQMYYQTGLEHTLLVDGQPAATSLAGPQSARTARPNTPAGDGQSFFTGADNQPYYALGFPLSPLWPEQVAGQPGLTAEVSLAVTSIAATQQSLVWTLIGSMVVVAAVGSLLGVFLARQISRPLARLTQAATALSQDDLDPPLSLVETGVREVTLVAQALENARIDLQRTLMELRREKGWTDHLLEAIVEGIVALDHEGRIAFFSPGAERITGWQRAEVLQQPVNEFFRPVDMAKPFSDFIPPPGRRQKVTVELANHRQATLAITGAQLTPPGTDDAWTALVFRDVSEAETIHRIMGHFLANVAHEFRTPLSALAASAELLLDQAPDLTPDELQELLISLHLGILGLQTLVDNLLESASIEAGRFQVHPRSANLGHIIAEAIRSMQPLLDKHGQRLVLELPVAIPVVRADSRRTIQVLVNLLSNASKYGPDEAEITVSVLVNQGWVRVAVADQGQGVLPQHRQDLFRRFVHLGSERDQSQYGAGLGLSVVKAIVEAQGGQVGVEDRPGGGMVFWFTLNVEGE
ncbi:MAG: PAS domain-containing protein [Anaerolineae bacterium]|nr:PAS domain-containing protein [Anaerolineae bacterium]